MTTSIEQIDLWLSTPTETQTLEFKEAKASFDVTGVLAPRCPALPDL